MANRSARTPASLSSEVRSRRAASLRMSDRCCSSSSLAKHCIYNPPIKNEPNISVGPVAKYASSLFAASCAYFTPHMAEGSRSATGNQKLAGGRCLVMTRRRIATGCNFDLTYLIGASRRSCLNKSHRRPRASVQLAALAVHIATFRSRDQAPLGVKATAWTGSSVTSRNAKRSFAAPSNRCALPRCEITPTSDLWFKFECIAYYTGP